MPCAELGRPADGEVANELVDLEEREDDVEREILLDGARVEQHPQGDNDDDEDEGHGVVLGIGVVALDAEATDREVVVGAGDAHAALVLGVAHVVLVAPLGAGEALDEDAGGSLLLPPPPIGVVRCEVLAGREAAQAHAAGLLARGACRAVVLAFGLPEAGLAEALINDEAGGADAALGVFGAGLAHGRADLVGVSGRAEGVALDANSGAIDSTSTSKPCTFDNGGLGGVVPDLAGLALAILGASGAGGAGLAIGLASQRVEDLPPADLAAVGVDRGDEPRDSHGVRADLDVPDGDPSACVGEDDVLLHGPREALDSGGGGEGAGGTARGVDEGGAEADHVLADVEVGVRDKRRRGILGGGLLREVVRRKEGVSELVRNLERHGHAHDHGLGVPFRNGSHGVVAVLEDHVDALRAVGELAISAPAMHLILVTEMVRGGGPRDEGQRHERANKLHLGT
mmetsp:Transcript_26339/g.84356  ORF Transcript_26339/g.84356 Transcript_26339/m.84356 type:complete len:457 (+) Transcript_26339:394-1764(+)